MKIREAAYNDIDKVADTRFQFILDVKGVEVPDKIKRRTIQYFKENIETDSLICYIAEVDNKIISIVILCIYQDIPKLTNSTGKSGYIYNVGTIKEYRKQGLATKLLKLAIKKAKGLEVKEIFLNSEIDAVSLYEGLGFRLIEREMILVT